MNITREQTGELTATVRIAMDPEDYQEKVNKVLKDLQHKSNIPGFRPGKVPFGLMRKMYGKAVLAEEINKLLGESLTTYIRDEGLEILGNPLANAEKAPVMDFASPDKFEFYFDLGMAPAFEVDLAGLPPFEHYSILVNDEMADRYIEDTRRRYGQSLHPETSGKEDMISGEITQLDEAGAPAEKGLKKNVFLNLTQIAAEEVRERLTGLSKGSRLRLVPVEFFGTAEEAARLLGIEAGLAADPTLQTELEVKDIYHVEPAPLDRDLFEKVYPGKNIETEEDFREQVRKDAAGSFAGETDKLFYRQVSDELLEHTVLPLPDDFLKRWLLDQQEQKMTPEDIENQYASFAVSTRWQLIENKLFRQNDISVKDEDIRNYIREYFFRQIPLSQDDPERNQRYESLVDTVMENKEQVSRINDELYTSRLLELFKTRLQVSEKAIPYEEFIKLASSLHPHDHDHGHDHDHEGHEHDHEH